MDVPDGIDPGWGYAPGRIAALGEAVRRRLQQSIAQSPRIAAAGVAGMLARGRPLAAANRGWREWREATPGSGVDNEFELGTLSTGVVEALGSEAAVTITRQRVGHLLRDSKVRGLRALGQADFDRLPEIVNRPTAVLRDRNDPHMVLLTFDPIDKAAAGRRGKVAVWVDYSTHRREGEGGIRRKVKTNSVRSAGYVEAHNLREPQYEVLEGEVE